MTTEATPESVPAEHVFTVTHYVRPAGNIGGWHQVTSAESDAAAAHQFIEERQAEADAAGLRPAVSAAAPLEATSAGESSQPTLDDASGQLSAAEGGEAAQL